LIHQSPRHVQHQVKKKHQSLCFFSKNERKNNGLVSKDNGEHILVPETPHEEETLTKGDDLSKDVNKRKNGSSLMLNLTGNNEDENARTLASELEADRILSVSRETRMDCDNQNSSKPVGNFEQNVDFNESTNYINKNKESYVHQDNQIMNDAECDNVQTDRIIVVDTDAAKENDANEGKDGKAVDKDNKHDDKDDLNEEESGDDDDDLPGLVSKKDNQVDINDEDDEILEESDLENKKGSSKNFKRIRNPTKFRKHIKTRGNYDTGQNTKHKPKAIMINLPSDIGSSDIEVVTRNKKGINRHEGVEDQIPKPYKSKRLPSTSESSDDNAAPSKGKRPKKRAGRILSSSSDSSINKDPNTSTPVRSRAVSGEAESLAEMIIRSPPSACCKKINSASGMPMRRRSSSASGVGMESSVSSIGQPESQNIEEEVENGEKSKKLLVLVQSNSGKFREPYTLDEEKELLQYFLSKGGFSKWRGTVLWKKIEKQKLLPGRSWQSMKQRFKMMLINKRLDKHGITEAMLSDADKRIYHGDEEDQDSEDQDDTNVTNNKKKTKPYTIEEDKKILKYITDNNRYNDTGGRAMWEVMEERQICGTRTYQSMKERFRKRILKNIKNYGLNDEQVKHFKKQLPSEKNEKQRRHRK